MNVSPIWVVCGTRPEIIKMAPVVKALRAEGLPVQLVHSGQHTDLAWPIYEFFGLTPDISIELVRKDGSLSALACALLESLSQAMGVHKPSAVLVHGDTSTAAMAAQAAFFHQIPVGHVEAGLRTYDKYSPFPEEMNRTLIGRIADWHYAPTPKSVAALQAEGIAAEKILMTGNTVIDAALHASELAKSQTAQAGSFADTGRLVLVTVHRRENWGTGLMQIAEAVKDILLAHSDVQVVWPLHANPGVSQPIRDYFAQSEVADDPRLCLTQPLGYPDLIAAMSRSWLVMTDSGGIQEEAPAFGVPVLVLRDTTERPELLEAGGGWLVGTDPEAIQERWRALETVARPLQVRNPFGDGHAAARIAKHLAAALNAAVA